MPCLIELGKTAKETHFQIGEKISKVCNLAIITSCDYFKELKQGALKNNPSFEDKIIYLQNPKQITKKINAILSLSKDASSKKDNVDNVVLIEGRVNKAVILAIENYQKS